MRTRKATQIVRKKQLLVSQQTCYEEIQLSHTLSVAFKPQSMKYRSQQKLIITNFIKQCLLCKGQGEARILCIYLIIQMYQVFQELVKQLQYSRIDNFKNSIKQKKAIFLYINAMILVKSCDIYKVLNKQFIQKSQQSKQKKTILLKLHQNLIKNKKIKIVVIDQIDFLATKDQSIFYNLFQWCNIPQTKFCLIIIANTMDFPERLMPKISSRMGNNRLVFRPYSQKQIQKIIQERLMNSKRFTQNAIVYACKKMSSYTSDIRKILNVLRISDSQEAKGTQIDISVIVDNWRRLSEEQGESWQQELHDSYKAVLNAIKENGGKAKDIKILQKLKILYNFSHNEIRLMMQQLQEMQLLNLKKVKFQGYFTLQGTLNKI